MVIDSAAHTSRLQLLRHTGAVAKGRADALTERGSTDRTPLTQSSDRLTGLGAVIQPGGAGAHWPSLGGWTGDRVTLAICFGPSEVNRQSSEAERELRVFTHAVRRPRRREDEL